MRQAGPRKRLVQSALPTTATARRSAWWRARVAAADGEPLAWLLAHKDYVGAGCLIWPFGLTNKGYGQVTVGGKNTRAHIWMCTAVHGPKPFPKAIVRHFECGNGHLGCCHPAHICWGTEAENKADSIAHGTHAR